MYLLKNNVGKADRISRILVGLLLIGHVFVGLQHPAGWIGLILIITGLFVTCPQYSILGLNSKSVKENTGLE
jgi:hypothetical protein